MKCKLCDSEAGFVSGKRGEAPDKWIFPDNGYAYIWPIIQGEYCYFHRKNILGLFNFQKRRPERTNYE